MKTLQRFAREEHGKVFADLGVIAIAAALLSWAFIGLSNPDLTQIVESVTVGQVLAIGQDGMADGIAMAEKPARVFLIGDKQ